MSYSHDLVNGGECVKLREFFSQYDKKEYFSLPNMLSYIRIALVPVWIWAFFTMPHSYLALTILLTSGLTDFLDGIIARKFNMITNWGKLIDPVADKLTQFAVVISLSVRYPSLWLVVALFVVKDGLLALGGYFLLRHNGKTLNGSRWFGKICTGLFYALICIILIMEIPAVGFNPFIFGVLSVVFEAAVAATMVLYVIEITKLWNE